MSLIQFVESRIRMGRMNPVAVSRDNRAVGFRESGTSAGGGWSRPSRTREADRHPVTPKRRWEIGL